MPFGTTLRSAALLLVVPLIAAFLSKIMGMFAEYIPQDTVIGQTFAFVGEYWLVIAVLSLVINVGVAANSESTPGGVSS